MSMSIEYATGDILEANVGAWVNPVNCVGVMGRGLAAQFKRTYPEMFAAYRAAAKAGAVEPGRMHVFALECGRVVGNSPTKRHWRAKAKLEDVEEGLVALAEVIRTRDLGSIAIPPLGCGLGGLDWEVVRPMVVGTFSEFPGVRVLVYEPL